MHAVTAGPKTLFMHGDVVPGQYLELLCLFASMFITVQFYDCAALKLAEVRCGYPDTVVARAS